MMNSIKSIDNNQSIENEFIFTYLKTSKYILLKWDFNEKEKKNTYYITNENNNSKDIGYVPNHGLLEHELIEDTIFSMKIADSKFKNIEFLKPKIVSVSFKEKGLELNNCEGFITNAELEDDSVITLVAAAYDGPPPTPPAPPSRTYIVEWETKNVAMVEIDNVTYNAEDKMAVFSSSSNPDHITFNAVSEFGFYLAETVKIQY